MSISFPEECHARMPRTNCCVSAWVCLICECAGDHISTRSRTLLLHIVPGRKGTSSSKLTKHKHILLGRVARSIVPCVQFAPFPVLSLSLRPGPSHAQARCPNRAKACSCARDMTSYRHTSKHLFYRHPSTNVFTILMSSILMSITSTPH